MGRFGKSISLGNSGIPKSISLGNSGIPFDGSSDEIDVETF